MVINLLHATCPVNGGENCCRCRCRSKSVVQQSAEAWKIGTSELQGCFFAGIINSPGHGTSAEYGLVSFCCDTARRSRNQKTKPLHHGGTESRRRTKINWFYADR